ncbi:MAG: hypothetical protein JXA33_27165, partial [Anaerolineae bacterium]|nr:hypothetical protein [Anaerolineae bacterium]
MHLKRTLVVTSLFTSLLVMVIAMGLAWKGPTLAARTAVTPVPLSRGGEYQLRGSFSSNTTDVSALSSSDLHLTWSKITIADNLLTVQAQLLTRTHTLNASAFIRDFDSTDMVMDNDNALKWAADVNDEAGFYFARPPDWDGVSPIKVTLYFALGGNDAGAVNWRLKLNTYTPNSGEWLTNPGDRDADTILTFPSGPSWYRLYSQTFTLTDAALSNEPLWSIFFLRGNAANSETFNGDLYVLGATVEY